jgi:hypothetical protein
MLKHLKYLNERVIKSFFDPGQALLSFTKEELIDASNCADYLILNDYEYSKFKEIINKTDDELLELYEKIIITFGSK